MKVGKTIRVLRVTRDLSQGKLARALKVSPGYLSLVEGDKREPSLGFLRRVAVYFDLPLGFLLLEDIEPQTFEPKQRRLLDEIRRTMLDYVLSRDSYRRKSSRRLAVK